MNDITLYEELSLNAHPSIRTQVFDGWVLRFANGYTNRANSINPLYPYVISVEDKIKYCEEIYKSQGLATIFKLTQLSVKSLDKILEMKCYEKIKPTNMMIKSLVSQNVFDTRAAVTDVINDVWQKNYFRLSGISDEAKIRTAKIIQGNILNKALCASIVENGIVIACGLCTDWDFLTVINIGTGLRNDKIKPRCKPCYDMQVRFDALHKPG